MLPMRVFYFFILLAHGTVGFVLELYWEKKNTHTVNGEQH